MRFIKFLISIFVIIFVFSLSFGFIKDTDEYKSFIEFYKKENTILINNKHSLAVGKEFTTLTDKFIPSNYDELVNIYYTVLYSGMTEFTFYCDDNYLNCIDDVTKINNDSNLLSQMNNFINVYNSFSSIETKYTNKGKITLLIKKIYSDEDIERIETKINSIISDITKNANNDYEKIKNIHDYIINNSKYDSNNNLNSNNALGPLFNKQGTCNGYTDLMSIFLNKLNIKNLRISNETHIWNLVYYNDKWLHIDLTWDDPINDYNKDLLLHSYFLKTTEELQNINKDEHIYNMEIYNFLN